MATPRAERTLLQYERRLADLRASIAAVIEREYGRLMRPDDIGAAFDRYAAQVLPRIEAGQATAQSLAAAYVRMYVLAETGRLVPIAATDRLAGWTQHGTTLRDGVAAIPSMIKGAIGGGQSVDQALEYGRFLVDRFADSEVVAVADTTVRTAVAVAGPTGWEGIVSAGACDRCSVANSGLHPLDTPLYRHAACTCGQRFVFGP